MRHFSGNKQGKNLGLKSSLINNLILLLKIRIAKALN